MPRPKTRFDLYDFDMVPASDTYPAAPTNNDVQFATAMAQIPAGGELWIPPDMIFSQTGQFVGGFGHLNTITRNEPLDIVGTGFASNLIPMAGFSAAAPNLLFNQASDYWFNVTLHDFAIGDDCVAPQYQRRGGAAVWFKSNSPGGMANTFIEKLRCGESGNNHSIIIDGIGTQHCRLKESAIWGGYHVSNCADNHIISDTDFLGWSTYGVLVDMPGAYGAKMTDCVVTAVGGTVFQSGTKNMIEDCTFEEQPDHPINNSWLTGVNGLLVLCGCPNGPVNDTGVFRNYFTMFTSTTNAHCLVTNQGNMGTARTHVAHNNFAIGHSLAAINNQDPAMVLGPNAWAAVSHFKTGSVLPVQTYGGG